MSLLKMKLFRIKTKADVYEFKKVLEQNEYDDQDFGFHGINFNSDEKLFANYTEKLVFHDETYDPYGNFIEEISYVNYKTIKFHIEVLCKGELLLVIYNPPKSVRGMFNNLSKIFNSMVGFNTLELELLKFKDSLEKFYGVELSSTGKLRASRFILDKDSKATIEITSVKNAFDSLTHIAKGKKFQLDKLTSSFYYNSHTADFEISKSGSLKVREQDKDGLLEVIKSVI